MSYIGNARPLLLFASNVRDDIIPDGTSSSFHLSQEVPGGYEQNILVLRQKYIVDTILNNSPYIEIVHHAAANDQIICDDEGAAAALSVVRSEIDEYTNSFHNLILSGTTHNDGSYKVIDVYYDGDQIIFEVEDVLTDENPALTTVEHGYVGFWEVLEAEVDYTIGGAGDDYNRIITFGDIPQLNDKLYVLHRGESTYNLVPSPNSVGPDQLQHNIRNFECIRDEGNGIDDTFPLSGRLPSPYINSKSLIVTVDGIIKDGDDPFALPTGFVGDWEVEDEDESGFWRIKFHTPPANGVKIRILNLSFSTVSRRSALSPGQISALAPGSVTTDILASEAVTTDKIQPGAVTTTRIADNNILGSKIRLANNQWLRGQKFDTADANLLRIQADDKTMLNGLGSVILGISGTGVVECQSSSVTPITDNLVDLGAGLQRWKNSHFSGQTKTKTLEVGESGDSGTTASIYGNLAIDGTVDGVDIAALQSEVQSLTTAVNNILQPGMMMMLMTGSVPSGWLLCDGSAHLISAYPNLSAALGGSFDNHPTLGLPAGGQFRVPDLRQRFPMGKAESGTGSGSLGSLTGVGGSVDHSHSGAAHTHTLSGHSHTIGAHYHEISAVTPAVGLPSRLNVISSGNHDTNLNHTHDSQHASGLESYILEGNPHDHSGSQTTSSGSHYHRIGKDISSIPGSFGLALNGYYGGEVLLKPTSSVGTNYNSPSGDGGSNHIHFVGLPSALFGRLRIYFNRNYLSISNGQHVHGHASFSGAVGHLGSGAINGNSNITSSAPNNNNTGAASFTSQTSTNNPPFMVTHFIIKT